MKSDRIIPQISVEELLLGITLLPTLLHRIEELSRQVAELNLQSAHRNENVKASDWMRLSEAADMLNLSSRTVRRYIARNLLSRSAASRHILIPAEDVKKLRDKVIL